jgi:prepilin-type N-terminal cleavage/methylation domain-containing protein
MAKINSMLKKRAGFTLVEVLVSLAILALVIWVAGGAVFMAADSYALTTRMQDDEYAARLAMLNISRELHRGWSRIEFTPIQYETDPVTGDILPIPATPATLNLQNADGTEELEYVFEKGYYDEYDQITRNFKTGTSPVAFMPVNLRGFDISVEGVSIVDGHFVVDDDSPGVPRIVITLVCENGLEVSTKVALMRIPLASPGIT